MYENRTLVRGDNLEEMRQFPDECIDLIATELRAFYARCFHWGTHLGTAQPTYWRCLPERKGCR